MLVPLYIFVNIVFVLMGLLDVGIKVSIYITEVVPTLTCMYWYKCIDTFRYWG